MIKRNYLLENYRIRKRNSSQGNEGKEDNDPHVGTNEAIGRILMMNPKKRQLAKEKYLYGWCQGEKLKSKK